MQVGSGDLQVMEFGDQEIIRSNEGEQIDKQIATAKRYPRSIAAFVRTCEEMATVTEEIAEECMYALPRDGKTIEGPSARLGEIVYKAWKNCRVGSLGVREDQNFVYATAFFFDVEDNTAVTMEVRRRIVDKHGRRFGPDMIAVTANAASSIARRNAIFAGIPKAFWIGVYKKVRHVIAGDIATLATRRAEVFAWMQKRGVDEARVLHALDKEGVADVGLDDFVTLKGMVNTIREGEATIDELFPDPKAAEREEKKKKGVGGLKDKMKGSAEGDGSTEAKAETSETKEPSSGSPTDVVEDEGKPKASE